jgi:tRNA-binding EMAP/Myf-like protein
VKNLKTAKLRGVESQGMILAAEKDNVLEVLSPSAPAGTKVEIEGIQAVSPLREISIDEFRTISFESKGGLAYVNGKKLLVDGKPIELQQVKDGAIR